jgi:UDP-glucose:(heptosyl)LPS alpha-1,3-glucosyltransferase
MGDASAETPVRLAFVRQRYTPGGGAERIIERAIDRLRAHRAVQVTILARRWPAASADNDLRPSSL